MQPQQAGLELVLPGLFILGVVLFGWIANFYLLYQFVVSLRNKTPRSRWSVALGVGWLLFIVGGVVRLAAPSGSNLAALDANRVISGIGTMLWVIGIGAWTYGFLQLRKIREGPSSVSRENTEPHEGDWPPPPKPPVVQQSCCA